MGLPLSDLCCDMDNNCNSDSYEEEYDYSSTYPDFIFEGFCDSFQNYCDAAGYPVKSTICSEVDYVDGLADWIYDSEALCGFVENGVDVPSMTDSICDNWADACVNSIPQFGSMCDVVNQNSDLIPQAMLDLDMDLEGLCCEVSYDCWEDLEVFYQNFVDYGVCEIDNNENTQVGYCDATTWEPVKSVLCANKDKVEEFVMDIDSLCGYVDEQGMDVLSETQQVCDEWANACTYDIPSITYMCENLWEVPDAVYTIFEDDFEENIYDFCYYNQDYEDFNVDDFCSEGAEFADICVDGYPDLVAVCEMDFPTGTFDGSNYLDICEVDIEDACEEFPDLCTEDGSISSDICGIYPEMCDESNSDLYNPCAADLYQCMMEEDFDLCSEFPELCGLETDFEIPTFKVDPSKPNTSIKDTNSGMSTYTCKAVVYESWGFVEEVIHSMNYFYNANITAGAYYDFQISMGARKYETLEATSSTQLGESQEVYGYLTVPDINIFTDYEEAEEFFEDIFGGDDEGDHIDLMGESWEHTEIQYVNSDGTDTFADAFSWVEFGYKLSSDETEPTYIGIMFNAEMPEQKMTNSSKIINWAKYTLYDNEGEETEESYAVACVITVGDKNSTEVHFYENTMNIESMDDEALDALEITPSPWELVIEEDEYYSLVWDDVESQGNARQSCLVVQVWEDPTDGDEEADDEFGWFFVESGVRYVSEDETEKIDFTRAYWDVEYRKPEEAPKLNIQVQGQAENTSAVTYVDDSSTEKTGTIMQSMYVGYEILEDIDSDNLMGMYLTLDLPTELASEGAVIVQTVRYRKEYSYGDWTTVDCKTVVGDSDATEIINYKGTTNVLDVTEGTYDSIAVDDKLNEEDVSEGEEFYVKREDDDGAYELTYGDYANNSKQNCLIQLPFPKTNMDPEWFGVYEVELNAKIYASESADTFTATDKMYTYQDFQPPIYTNDELIEQIENINSVFGEEFLYEHFNFSMNIIEDGSTEEGYQSIWGTLLINPDPEADQVVEIKMETVIPVTFADDMMDWTVQNYITFTNKDDDEQDPAKIMCRTKIGDKYESSVSQYDSDVDMKLETSLYNDDMTLDWEESFFTASPDFDKFETEADETYAWALCTIELVLNENNQDTVGNLFDQIYKVEYGVRLFDANDENPIDVSDVNFTFKLPSTDYDSTWDDEEDEPLMEQTFGIDIEAITGQAADAYQSFEINFESSPEYDVDDVLKIRFVTDAPTSLIAGGSTVVQWAQFRLAADQNGDFQKVQCKSVQGGQYADIEVETFVGATELKDEGVASTALDSIQTDEKLAADDSAAYQKSDNEDDFMFVDSSDISGNYFITCTVDLPISKVGREFSIFGEYDVIMGTRVYATSTAVDFTSFGEQETSYYLEEPSYTDGDEETDEADLTYVYIDDKSWDIDVEKDLGFSGRGSQYVYSEIISSPYYYEDDVLRVWMDISLPEDSLKNGTVVYQYMQLIGKDEEEGVDAYIGIGCQTTVGEEGSQKVENFYGTTKMDAVSTSGKKVAEQNEEQKDEEYGAFQEFDEDWGYQSYEDGTGNKVQMCVVDMPIPKGDERDEDIFKKYVMTKGARIYEDEDDTQPIQIGEKKTVIDLGKADYDPADIVDPEILAKFEKDDDEKWADDYVETEISFQGSQDATVDAASLFGEGFEDAVAQQQFYSVYESNPYIDMDDEISFQFVADLPTDKMQDGVYIVQLVTLSPTADANAESLTIGCIVQVGNPEAVKAYEWMGTTDMSFASNGNVIIKEINTGELVADSEVKPNDDADFYALGESDLSWANSVQNCQAALPIEKQGTDSSIFTTYTALLQARIYASKDDTSPINLSETTFEITLEAPVYEDEEWDQYDEDWYEDVENEFFIINEEEFTITINLEDGTQAEVKHSLWIDTWVNKEYTRPDVLDFTFNAEGPAEKLADGKILFSYATFNPSSDTSGTRQTVGCKVEIGNSDNYEIYNWKGDSDFADATVENKAYNELHLDQKTADDDDDNFRESYSDWDYTSYTWEDNNGSSTTWAPCKASLDLPKIGRDDAIFTDYEVTTGLRIYNPSDMTTFETMTEETFTYTLTAPSYEFGDEYEFNEAPYEDAIFTEFNTFDVADYIDGAEGTGFQKIQGMFKAVPNFETTIWMFKFSLEMPEEYFNTSNYLFQWATYVDTAGTMDAVTVACGITIDDAYSSEIFEYDATFDSTTQTTLPAWETNYAAMVEDGDFKSSADTEDLWMLPSLNNKKKQKCIAQVEIAPEEAADLFDREYTVTVGGRVYDGRDDPNYVELPSETYTYFIPAAEFTFEDKEETVLDTQIVAEEDFGYDGEAYTGIEGDITQYLAAGFETNPYDDTANDFLGFQFEIEAGEEVFKQGNLVYQWITYAKSDDFSSDPISIACATKVGDPYVSEVKTFKGTNSMGSASTTVEGRTWDAQNTEDKAGLKDSFGLIQDVEWYDQWSPEDGVIIQPCVAVIEYDGKLNSTNEIFGTYNVTLGARIYNDTSSTEPIMLPEQEFQIEFTVPESDLSVLYEEDVVETKSETVIYLDDKFRFKVEDVWTTAGVEGRGFMRVQGGYKLYGTSGAEDRWFFNLALEIPTTLFTDDEIIYMWLKYADDDMTDEYTGVVGCKVVVGDPSKTKVDQWIGDVNMNSDSANVVGKKWYKQNKEGKMTEPDYYALWYKDIFNLQESTRGDSGEYSIQMCEVEIKLNGATPDTMTYDMQMGMRFYADSDATEFLTTKEPEFDWYNEQMEYSDDLEEEPVYEDSQKEKQADEAFTFEPTDVFSDKITVYEAAVAAEAAAAAAEAAAAEEEAATNGAETNSNMVIGMQGRQEETTYQAEQTFSNGYTTYEQTVASDWWYWVLSLDMPSGLFADEEVLYQWATLVDQSDVDPLDPFTIACKRTIGDSETYVIDYFSQTTDESTALYPDSDLVTPSITWDAQAPDLREEDEDHVWVASSEHADLASASTIDGNTKFSCYLAKELPKIGRNPADFDKTFAVYVGARIYETETATEFITIPMAESTFEYPQVPGYEVAVEEVEGSFALFASSIAAIAVLFMAF